MNNVISRRSNGNNVCTIKIMIMTKMTAGRKKNMKRKKKSKIKMLFKK